VHLWLSAFGVEQARLDAFEKKWAQQLQKLFA